MTIKDVENLLNTLNLGEYRSVFAEKGITGKRLSFVKTEEELVNYGIANPADARYFLNEINERKITSGNSYCLIYSNRLHYLFYYFL